MFDTRVPQVSISPGSLLLWQTIYYGIERVIRFVHAHYFRDAHAKLLSARRDLAFFGVSMGFLITLICTPFCITAFLQGDPSVDSPTTSSANNICVTSRAVLWISELSRLGDNTFYLTHHLFSLSVLGYFVTNNIPMTVLNLVFSSLITELASDPIYLLEAHGHSAKSSRWTRNLERLVLVLYIFVRLPPIWYGCYWLKTVGTTILRREEIAFCAFSLVAYFAFNAYCIVKLAAKRGIVTLQFSHAPENIRLGKHILTLYGAYMGLGLASLASVTLIVYSAAIQSALYELQGTAKTAELLPIIILWSILGARLMSLVFEDGFRKVANAPVSSILRPGFWLHGGLIGAGSAIWYYREMIPDTSLLISSMGIALPLYEVFSRVGCSSYGCCYGIPMMSLKKTPAIMRLLGMSPIVYTFPDAAVLRHNPSMKGVALYPVQNVSAAIYLLQFVFSISLLSGGWCSVLVLGKISFSIHAAVRIMLEPFRSDFRGGGAGWTVTGVAAGAQMVGGVFLALQAGPARVVESGFDWGQVVWSDVMVCSCKVLGLASLTYGYNYQQIGRWIK